MRLRNISDDFVRIPSLGIDCAPGEVVDVPDGYAVRRPLAPRGSTSGQLAPSAVDDMSGGRLVPADDDERAKYEAGSDALPEVVAAFAELRRVADEERGDKAGRDARPRTH